MEVLINFKYNVGYPGFSRRDPHTCETEGIFYTMNTKLFIVAENIFDILGK
jgi:hypothetical protein